jgi:hypothetical protein
VAALAHDGPAARAMGQNARQLARRFDRRVAVQAYYDLFAGIAGAVRAA